MTTKFMPEEKAIKLHLHLHQDVGDNKRIYSSFIGALRDARKFTGRYPETGKKLGEGSGDPGSWLGAIGYLILLDQIGTCFKPKNNTKVEGNSIQRALKYFTLLSDYEIDAIYALRCSFAHDYSLSNINDKLQSRTHHFSVHQGASHLVILPEENWDGDYENRTLKNRTKINVEDLGSTVEQICDKLRILAEKSELEVILSGGTDELLSRYGIFEVTKSP